MFLGDFSFPKGSQVAGIDVEGLKVDEAKEVLQKEINDWQNHLRWWLSVNMKN